MITRYRRLFPFPFTTCCIVVLLFVSLGEQHVAAQTASHWRFEHGDGFLRDSIGNAHLESIGDPVAAVTLPSDNRGAAFPTSFGNLGANSTAAEFTDSLDGFVAENAELQSGDSFTVEVFAHVASYGETPGLFHLVSQAAPAVLPTETFWSFQIPTDEAFRELNVNFGGNTTWHATRSGILIDESTDYYVSAAFDDDSREVRYYAQNLNDRSLRISSVPYVQDQLQDSDEFLIGDVPACSCWTDGLIDEVRVSVGVLDYPETLVGQADFGGSDYAIETISLSPRDAYLVREDRTRNLRALRSGGVTSSQKPIFKFDLPSFVEPAELESATLRLFVSSASGENAELELWHSLTDNDFEREVGDFAGASYVDTQTNVVGAGDEVGSYVDVDVTDLILDDLNQDGNNPVSAFRLSASDGARFRLAMPRNVERQPLLLFSLRPSSTSGDFNRDGILDADDIDLLTAAIGTSDPEFDVNSDGIVDQTDHTMWVKELKNTWFGDANLDGEFSSVDFVSVFQTGKFETDQDSGWSEGDWNGDGVFSSSDFVKAFQDGGYEQGPRGQVVAVPEPSVAALLVSAFLWMSTLGRRQK